MKKSVPPTIRISIADQKLVVLAGRKKLRTYPVSTSAFGIGTEEGSMKTPTGRFLIAKKFGKGAPIDAAFKSRKRVRTTKKMLREADLVMSRILWLDGRGEKNAHTPPPHLYT